MEGRHGVPVRPNAALIEGNLLGISSERDGFGENWRTKIRSVREVDGFPNFAKGLDTKPSTELYVHPKLKRDIPIGGEFTTQISFMGDDAGGRFFVTGEINQK